MVWAIYKRFDALDLGSQIILIIWTVQESNIAFCAISDSEY